MPRRPKAIAAIAGDLEAAASEVEEEEKVAVFEVSGMTCAACADSVEKAVKRLPGVHEAAVDVLGCRAQVAFYPAFVSEEKIRETIEDVGFGAILINEEVKEKSILVCRLHIKGMTCTFCASTVESALQVVPGVQRASVALAIEEAEIRYDRRVVAAAQLIHAVEETGFEAILVTTGEDRGRIDLKVHGILNERSEMLVKSSVQALPGVEDVKVDTDLQKITISYMPDKTGPRDLIKVIESAASGHVTVSIYPDITYR